MRVWAVANQKGGVGKTTTAVTLAGIVQKRGKRVLLVDLDPHGSMTSYFGFDPDEIERSAYELFRKTLAPSSMVLKTPFRDLSLIPASSAMATLDRQLGTADGMGVVIKNAMATMYDDYDYAIIDCPPVLGLLMVNALAACRQLIIPVQTEFLAIKGLERMHRTLEMMHKAGKNTIEYTIVPTFYDRRTRASIDSLSTLRSRFAKHVWDDVIPVDTQFREASRIGAPLSIQKPGSRGSRAYARLLDSLMEKEQSL